MRGGPRQRAFWLALLLVSPLVAATSHATTPVWDEVAGGPGRTGAAFLPTATLDILWNGTLFDGLVLDLERTQGIVSTPHGLLAVASDFEDPDISCYLLRLSPGDRQPLTTPLDQCQHARLVAYDEARDRLILCSFDASGEIPVLQARAAATGALVWGVDPAESGPASVVGDSNDWECNAAVSYQGDIITAMSADAEASELSAEPALSSMLLRVDGASGQVKWVSNLSGSQTQARIPVLTDQASQGSFNPIGLALTSSGLVVSGTVPCPCAGTSTGSFHEEQAAVLLVDPVDGDVRDGFPASQHRTSSFLNYGATWATTSGPLAAFPLAGSIVKVNPDDPVTRVAAPFYPVQSGAGLLTVVPPVWWGDTIAVPVGESVTGLDAGPLTHRWSWTNGPGWRVGLLFVVPPTDLFVVVGANPDSADDREAIIARLDLDSGDLLQAISLPQRVDFTTSYDGIRVLPLANGTMLLFDGTGRGFLLGEAPAEGRPLLTLSNAFPGAIDSTDVAVVEPRPDARYSIAWGDGAFATNGTSWSHRYGVDGDQTVHVTAIHADGTTATSAATIHVGAAPPPQLTALQRALAPENYDLTFGLLGLFLTLLGALIALALRRRRHSVLKVELDALAAIESAARTDVENAVRDLGAYRGRLLDGLGAQRLDDAQYNTLSARADLVAAAIRARLLGPVAGRLSDDFRHIIDIALHDGKVEADELEGIRATLSAERGLNADEKARLFALFGRLAQD